jgi:hypothetical protein
VAKYLFRSLHATRRSLPCKPNCRTGEVVNTINTPGNASSAADTSAIAKGDAQWCDKVPATFWLQEMGVLERFTVRVKNQGSVSWCPYGRLLANWPLAGARNGDEIGEPAIAQLKVWRKEYWRMFMGLPLIHQLRCYELFSYEK